MCGVTNLHQNGENTNGSESLVITEGTYLVCCSYRELAEWWRDDGEASVDEIVVVQRCSWSPPPHPLASSLFSAHLPPVSFLRLPPLCLTLSCSRASICLQSFLPSPPTPSLSSSSQISPISLSFPQLLPCPLPV